MKTSTSIRKIAIIAALAQSGLFVEGEPVAAPGGGSTSPDASTGTDATKVDKAPKAKRAKKAKSATKKPAGKKLKTKKAGKAKRREGSGEKAMNALKAARKEYSKPKGVKTAGGNQAVDSGDAVAKRLRGMDLGKVYDMAAKVKEVSAGTLKAKYRHLNAGAQRMTLGNIIRAAS